MDLNIAPLSENAITAILRNAENSVADGTDPKAAVVDAALDFIAEAKAFDIRDTVKAAVDMQIMIFGNDHAQIIAALREAEPEFAKVPDETAVTLLVWSGDDLDLDATLRNFVKAVLPAPLPMNRGKWLSKLGIVKAHIDAIVPATARVAETPEAPPPPSASTSEYDMAAMLGNVPATAPPPPPGYGAVATQTVAPAVGAGDVRQAIITFADALDMKDAELAQRLGISRSTLHNMVSGKTQRVKCSLEQARVFLAEIDTRIGKLNAAAETFRQVR